MDLRELRKKKGVTQTALAGLLGTKRSTVAMWETGKSQPKTKDLSKIAEVLECSTENVLDCFKPTTDQQ